MTMRRIDTLTPEDRARLEAEARARGGNLVEVLLPGWAAFYLEERDQWEACNPGGFLPPIAVACTGGRMLAIVIARQVSRDLGLQAARVLLNTADPDEVWVAFEVTGAAHDREMSEEEFERLYPRGRLQRLAELGFSGEGTNIFEMLNVFRICCDGVLDVAILPYERHDPARGQSFGWTSTLFKFTDARARPREAALPGLITDALRTFAAEPRMADHPRVVAYRETVGWDRAHSLLNSTRSGLRLLRRQGFVVVDLMSRDHPGRNLVPVDEEPADYDPGEQS